MTEWKYCRMWHKKGLVTVNLLCFVWHQQFLLLLIVVISCFLSSQMHQNKQTNIQHIKINTQRRTAVIKFNKCLLNYSEIWNRFRLERWNDFARIITFSMNNFLKIVNKIYTVHLVLGAIFKTLSAESFAMKFLSTSTKFIASKPH